MPDEVNAAEFVQEAPTQEGTVSADRTVSAEGQPGAGTEQAGGEPTAVEGLPEDWTAETLGERYKSYTELQSEFGKRNDAFKDLEGKFAPYGGFEKLLESAQYLQNNSSFQEWVKSEQEKGYYGDKNEDLTDENKQAVEIVQRIVDSRVEQALKERVTPLENGWKERATAENFKKMDDMFGNDWREQQDSMAKLGSTLPDSVQDNPSFDDIQDLYWSSLRRDGKMDAVMAKTYQKKLESTKSKSTEKPASAPATGKSSQKVSTMTQAFNLAKEAG